MPLALRMGLIILALAEEQSGSTCQGSKHLDSPLHPAGLMGPQRCEAEGEEAVSGVPSKFRGGRCMLCPLPGSLSCFFFQFLLYNPVFLVSIPGLPPILSLPETLPCWTSVPTSEADEESGFPLA